MDYAEDVTKSIGAATPLLKSAAYWRAGTAAKAAGEAKGTAADLTARLMRVRGGQEFAASQREMLNEKKKEELVQSALQARAAASGGASDPSVVKAAGDIAAEGRYRALTALYKGKDLRTYLENAAALKGFEGAEYRRAGEIAKRSQRLSAYGSLLGGFEQLGALSFKGKYNPTPTNVAPWRDPDIFSSDEFAGP